MLLFFAACTPWKDSAPPEDPRIKERKYCNDPRALNYNWGFPGLSDSAACIYPADIFAGEYSYTDTIYFADLTPDSTLPGKTYTLLLTALSYNKLSVKGFCPTGQEISLTAERTTFQAHIDTTIQASDTTWGYGQFLCREADTLTGYITKSRTDSLLLSIQWTVVSDTGIRIHRGTAIRTY